MASETTRIILLLIALIKTASGAGCSYPLELAGTVIGTGGMYHRIEEGNWTRSDGEFLRCEYTDGNLYISRMEELGYDIIQCHQFIRVTNQMYEVQERTIEDPKRIPKGQSVGDISACSAQTDKPYDFELFIQPSAIDDDYPCPTNLQKMFFYKIKTGDEGEVDCACDSKLNTCDNRNHMLFDYTRCSIQVVSSVDSTLRCIYNKQESGGLNYVILRRHNNIVIPKANDTLKHSTDAFACMVFKDYGEGILEATIVPLDRSQPRCREKQSDKVIDNRLNGNHLYIELALECTGSANTGVFDQRKLECSACRHQIAALSLSLSLVLLLILF